MVQGCSPISQACEHCWAARESAMREQNPNPKISDRHRGLTSYPKYAGDYVGPPRFNGTVRVNEEALQLPMRTRKPAVWSIWTDLFHEDVPFEFVTKAFCVMDYCRHHTFLICTKRPHRLDEFATEVDIGMPYMADEDDPTGREGGWESWPLPNVIIGTTAENSDTAFERVPYLVRTPAARRFISMEPLMGPVDFGDFIIETVWVQGDDGEALKDIGPAENAIHWITAGGESGPGARPSNPRWVRSVRDQCAEWGIPFHFKQWGEWAQSKDHPDHVGRRDMQDVGCFQEYATRVGGDILPAGAFERGCVCGGGQVHMVRAGKKKTGRLLDGVLHDAFPEPVA